MEVTLNQFRESGSHATWSEFNQSWICGDAVGNIHQLQTNAHQSENVGDGLITALSAPQMSHSSALAFSLEDIVLFTDFPQLSNNIQATSFRRTLNISKLEYDNSGTLLFVASEEPDIVVYSTARNCVENRISSNGLNVRTVKLSQKNNYIGVVDGKGGVKVHKIEYSESGLQGVGRSITNLEVVASKQSIVPKKTTTDQVHCKISWYPFEEERLLVAFPSDKGSVVFLEKVEGQSEWVEHLLVVDPTSNITHDNNALNIVQFSPNGKYLVSADVGGRVLVWQLNLSDLPRSEAFRTVFAPSNSLPLVDLAWGRAVGDNHLLFLTEDSYGFAEGVVSAKLPAPSVVASGSRLPGPPISQLENLFETQDEPVIPSSSIEPAVKPVHKRLTKQSAADDHDDDNDNLFDTTVNDSIDPPATAGGEETISIKQIKSQSVGRSRVVAEEEDLDDEEDEDEDVLPADNKVDIKALLQMAKTATAAAHTPLQPPFQPSSTRPDEKLRRYLAWNNVGSITSRDESTENRIEIRFSNSIGTNKNEHFADRSGFTMAALGYEGAVFATDREEHPDGHADEFAKPLPGSVLYYHAFAGQKQLEGVNESFRMTLADGEGALAVAVGKGWVAVATTKQLLRVFSSAGLQTKVIWLSGPVVCLCGFDSLLAVVYHGATPLQDTFQLRVDLHELDWRAGCRGKVVLRDLRVPLSPKSTLTWVGFDVDHSLITVVDSCGLVSVLTKVVGAWEWTPLMDIVRSRKSLDHIYWPVTVKNDKLVFVLLNGESKPQVYPQPVVTTRPFRVLLTEVREGKDVGDAHKEKVHALLWSDAKVAHYEALKSDCSVFGQSAFRYDDYAELEESLDAQTRAMDTLVLKQFQEACQLQKVPLALNLALKLRSEVALTGAVQVANYFGRTSVASYVDSLLQNLRDLTAQIQDHSFSQFEGGDDYAGSEAEQTQQEVEEPTESRVVGSLTSRVSSRQLLPPSGKALSKVVSPPSTVTASPGTANQSGVSGAMNPFAVSSTGSTPNKRKNAFDAVQDLKASPSPKKPALLNRQSTFSQNARQAKLSDKTLL